mmetsp:Transcript_60/g.154  ORF Transcript_60/g.154 Transcript_60/m.154 type:complete len:1081 (+) Transcript_60:120-3362(+)
MEVWSESFISEALNDLSVSGGKYHRNPSSSGSFISFCTTPNHNLYDVDYCADTSNNKQYLSEDDASSVCSNASYNSSDSDISTISVLSLSSSSVITGGTQHAALQPIGYYKGSKRSTGSKTPKSSIPSHQENEPVFGNSVREASSSILSRKSKNSCVPTQINGIPNTDIDSESVLSNDNTYGEIYHPSNSDLVNKTSGTKVITTASGEQGAFTGIFDAITGEMVHGRLITAESGQVYEGSFMFGKRHGDDAIWEKLTENTKFYGSFRNDVPFRGVLMTDDFTYRGSLDENLLFHGMHECDVGSLVKKGCGNGDGDEDEDSGGTVYEGEFRRGRYHGAGREILGDGSVYKGEFTHGSRHGVGLMLVPKSGSTRKRSKTRTQVSVSVDGDPMMPLVDMKDYGYTYSGVWWHGYMEGEGNETTSNGEEYTGQFFRSKRHGFGILRTESKFTYEGTWRAGSPVDGAGWVITYPDGSQYNGSAENFLPHGIGTLCDLSRNEVFYGEFQCGKRHGEGLCVLDKVEDQGEEIIGSYYGTWEDDVLIPESKKPVTADFCADPKLTTHGNIHEATFPANSVALPSGQEDDACSILSVNDKPTKNDDHVKENQDQFKSATNNENQDAVGFSIPDICTFSHPAFAIMESAIKSTPVSIGRHIGVSQISFCSRGRQTEDDEDYDENDLTTHRPKTLHTYPNNDTFLGYLDLNGRRQGTGLYTENRSRSTYDGEWRDNLRHGRGVLLTAHAKYCGEYKDDHRHGQGTLIWNDNSCYNGQFQNGNFHGIGTYCNAEGGMYTGGWMNGLRHGEGLETYNDGKVFLGEYKDGKRSGVGTLLEKKGGDVIYSGEWINDQMDGEGVLVLKLYRGKNNSHETLHSHYATAGAPIDDTFDEHAETKKEDQKNINNTSDRPRRRQYEGSFSKGQMSGKGTLTTEDGIVFSGNWHRGHSTNGLWDITYRDGSTFSGKAVRRLISNNKKNSKNKNSKPKYSSLSTRGGEMESNEDDETLIVPHGMGSMKYANGDAFTGKFVHGIRSGKGVCTFANGDRYDGDWINDKLDINGSGSLRLCDGTTHRFNGKKRRQNLGRQRNLRI